MQTKSFLMTTNEWSIYNLKIDGNDYPIRYLLTGAELKQIIIAFNVSTMEITLDTSADGKLTIELPRALINSYDNNSENEFVVLIDEVETDVDEIYGDNVNRVLEIDFEHGAEKIEIVGSTILPERKSSAITPPQINQTNTTTDDTADHYYVYIKEVDSSLGTYVVDVDESHLLEGIVTPFVTGKRFLCRGAIIDPFNVKYIRIYKTSAPYYDYVDPFDTSNEELWNEITKHGQDVTQSFIKSLPTRTIEKIVDDKNKRKAIRYDSKKVFIVHGHNASVKNELARFLESLKLRPIILHEKEDEGNTIIEKFEKHASTVGYAFVLLTSDDVCGKGSKRRKHRARQNVILELGYFMGKLGRKRVCCLYKEGVELPSDIHGLLYVGFEKSLEPCYFRITRELRKAGYNV